MNEITLRATFGAAAAPGITPVGQYTEPVRVAGPTLMVQVIGVGADVTVQGSNLPGVSGSWVDVASVVAGVPEQVECLYGYVRVSADAPCDVGVSGVHGTASVGGGGGGGVVGGALEATQQSVLAALASIDAGTPSAPLVQPLTDEQLRAAALPLPTGAATEATLAATSAKLPASLGGKPGSGSLSVTTATGVVTSISGSITAGGAAQQLAAANAARRGLTLQNTSSGELRVSPWGGASATAGYKVSSGEMLVLDAPHCGVGVVSVWGATAAQTFIGGESV